MSCLGLQVSRDRFAAMSQLTSWLENVKKSVMIFCNRTQTATLLEYMLRSLEHRVTALHSGLKQSERVANLARFRAQAARILVASDVAARGLDIPEVALVINYDVPRDPDDYIHRVRMLTFTPWSCLGLERSRFSIAATSNNLLKPL